MLGLRVQQGDAGKIGNEYHIIALAVGETQARETHRQVGSVIVCVPGVYLSHAAITLPF